MVQVDGRHHDVARSLALQLDDALTQVGLHHLDALPLQIGIHPALLRQHRLRFYDLLHVVVLQDAIDDLIEFGRILRPVDDTAVFLGLGGKLVQVFVKVGDGVALDGAGLLAQLLPFLKTVCHIVTFGAH